MKELLDEKWIAYSSQMRRYFDEFKWQAKRANDIRAICDAARDGKEWKASKEYVRRTKRS